MVFLLNLQFHVLHHQNWNYKNDFHNQFHIFCYKYNTNYKMPAKKGNKKLTNEEIFEEIQDYQEQDSLKQQNNPPVSKVKNNSDHQEEEGQILEDDEVYSEEEEQHQIQVLNINPQNQEAYPDSSDEDNDRLQKERKKREEFWKHKNMKNQQAEAKNQLTESELLEVAFTALQKTNKRVLLMRKKNEKRMQDLDKIRMAQQPYLTASNTHFRGTSSQYAIITHDSSGKALYHPNHSFRIGQMRLQNFILKNIKQQSTANYLNEVVKFQNYAYQQRKKRRHNIE